MKYGTGDAPGLAVRASYGAPSLASCASHGLYAFYQNGFIKNNFLNGRGKGIFLDRVYCQVGTAQNKNSVWEWKTW